MNLNNDLEDVKNEILEEINAAEDKGAAIIAAIEKFVSAKNDKLIQEIVAESEQAKADKEFYKELNLRTLSKEEKDFYQLMVDAKQSVTADQIDIIPTTIIDRTLVNIRKESKLLKYVNFAPADVKKWLVGSKTGTFVWGKLTDAIAAGGELGADIDSLNIELGKVYCYLIIPKAIRDLSLPFVDKYFTAILNETLLDGLEAGVLTTTGKDSPISLYKQIEELNADGTHKDKTLLDNITDFRPKTLAPIKKTLSNNGKRSIDKIILVCNPADKADYVDPAMYDSEGRNISSYKNIEVIDTPQNPQGKGLFYLPETFTMGFSGFKVDEYKETKALEDANLMIGKAYANGRADDDNCAVAFDITTLEEYIERVSIVGTVSTEEVAGA